MRAEHQTLWDFPLHCEVVWMGTSKHFYLFLQSVTTHIFTTMPRQTWGLTSKKDWLYLLCVIYFTLKSVTGRERWDTQL